MRLTTVLIADDEPCVRMVVATALRNNGYEVMEAGDGMTALQLAAQHAGPIDLLLTDVRMPGLQGPEVCALLRRQRPETRFLLMSGYPDGLEENSGTAFVAKPFRIPELLQCVQHVLGTAQPV